MKPDVSVVVLSDFAPGAPATHQGLRAALAALRHQTFSGATEFLLVESERFRDELPGDLTTVLPGLRIVFAQAEGSYALRNVGVEHATADLVAFLDADCVPEPEWLRRLITGFWPDPAIAAVSGRTRYPGHGTLERMFSLLSRAYVDRGDAGPVRHVSCNNCVFRKAALVTHPFPQTSNPFIEALHAGAVMREGGRLWFEPEAVVTHAFGGWSVERDVSRNVGWAAITIRQLGSEARGAWLARLGYLAIPVFVAAAVVRSWGRLLRLRRHYGIGWHELPVGLGVAVAAALMQARGMRDALRGRTIDDTSYR